MRLIFLKDWEKWFWVVFFSIFINFLIFFFFWRNEFYGFILNFVDVLIFFGSFEFYWFVGNLVDVSSAILFF